MRKAGIKQLRGYRIKQILMKSLSKKNDLIQSDKGIERTSIIIKILQIAQKYEFGMVFN